MYIILSFKKLFTKCTELQLWKMAETARKTITKILDK